MRRAISAKLSAEIPQTQPINAELAKNLEARSFLDKKLGDVARDPVGADAQQSSELAKGQTILANRRPIRLRRTLTSRNWLRSKPTYRG